MVSLAPPLQAVLEIQLHLESGQSVAEAIRSYVKTLPEESFAKELGFFLFTEERGGDFEIQKLKSPYRKHLIELLKRGLQGEPILEGLEELEKDLIEAAKQELEIHLQKLPFLCLIPLLLFEFPALLLLLIGPLLSHLFLVFQN